MNRTAALEALATISLPIPEAISCLANFPWDCETELVQLNQEHFRNVLLQFEQGVLSAVEVEGWANALECRDDVGFATSLLRELLHELANPLLTQPLSGERANFWLSQLQHVR